MLKRGQLCVPVLWGSLGFYSSVESDFYACATSLFHIGKILINGRIFKNPLCVRILLMMVFYKLGLIVRRKSFPFRIPWRPHNEQIRATWPIGPSTLDQSYWIRPYTLTCYAHTNGPVIHNFNLSSSLFFLFSCPHPVSSCSLSGRTREVTV